MKTLKHSIEEALVKKHIPDTWENRNKTKKEKLEDIAKTRNVSNWNNPGSHVLIQPLEIVIFNKIDESWECNEITGNPINKHNQEFNLIYFVAIEWILESLTKNDYKFVNIYIIPDQYNNFDQIINAWESNKINTYNLEKL